MDDGLRAFIELKALLLKRYRAAYPHFQGELADFRQADIANFQDLLEEHAQGLVSEKWFYTHLKVSDNEKLPRIDTLNLLARFVGFPSWEAFLYTREQQTSHKRRGWIVAAALIAILLTSAAFRWWPSTENSVTLCFYDALRRTPITDVEVGVSISYASLKAMQAVKPGEVCITFPNVSQNAQILCSARYYHSDTILIDKDDLPIKQDVYLRTDDYALMIHYFSNSKVQDWKKRREQLAQVFSDEAVIYQLDPEGLRGMDILNKTDFINRMTIPSKSLRGVEVLETVYQDGKIIELRFTIKE